MKLVDQLRVKKLKTWGYALFCKDFHENLKNDYFQSKTPLNGDYWLMKILSFSNLNEITK